jgi:uncharacterized protein (TIGR02246 family)
MKWIARGSAPHEPLLRRHGGSGPARGARARRVDVRLSRLLVPLLIAGACAPAPAPELPQRALLEAELSSALQASAEGWNRGDLDAYLGPYAQDVVFMGADGPVHGREAVRERFRRVYFPAGQPIQRLRVEPREVRPLSADHALQTGRWFLSGGDRPDREGWFTLLWERRAAGWRIVHDHSS